MGLYSSSKEIYWNFLRRRERLQFAREGISLLHASSFPEAETYAYLINKVLRKDFQGDEKKWITKIENLRDKLNASNETITIFDFGAGRSHEHRTAEQMHRGVVVTRTIGETCRSASKPPFWAQLLFAIVREYKPHVCVEMGTSLGISGAYIASAIGLNGAGKLVTLEGSDDLARIAAANFETLGLTRIEQKLGRFSDTLEDVLNDQKPVDFIFVDGHHDEQATKSYFKTILPFLNDDAILVFDDVCWSEGMQRAWQHIKESSVIKIVLDLGPIGICHLTPHATDKHEFKFIFPL